MNDNLQKSIKTKIDKINSLQMEILNINIDSKTEVDNILIQLKNEINNDLLEYKNFINQEFKSIKNDINILNIDSNSLNSKLNDIGEKINYNSISKFIDEKFIIFQTQYNIHLNNKINELITPQFDKLVYSNNIIYQKLNELNSINNDIYDNINKINETSLEKNNEFNKKIMEIEKSLENNLITIDLKNTEAITKIDEDIKIQKACFSFSNIF